MVVRRWRRGRAGEGWSAGATACGRLGGRARAGASGAQRVARESAMPRRRGRIRFVRGGVATRRTGCTGCAGRGGTDWRSRPCRHSGVLSCVAAFFRRSESAPRISYKPSLRTKSGVFDGPRAKDGMSRRVERQRTRFALVVATAALAASCGLSGGVAVTRVARFDLQCPEAQVARHDTGVSDDLRRMYRADGCDRWAIYRLRCSSGRWRSCVPTLVESSSGSAGDRRDRATARELDGDACR